MNFVISPFRQGSTRFPNKFLHKINGHPMWWHVYRNLVECPHIDGFCVAYPLDDAGIRLSVDEYKAPHVCTYTDPDHKTGTDRVFEAVRRLGIKRGIIINAQADEPLVTHRHVEQLLGVFDDPAVKVATLVCKAPPEDVHDEDCVKVLFDGTMRIFAFDRIISEPRYVYYTNIGLHAFRFDALAEFAGVCQSDREKTTNVELYRFLDIGISVHAVVSDVSTIGVDRPSDIGRVEAALNDRSK